MHLSSYDRMAEFCREYLTGRENEKLTIIDLGSCDYNGSYRPIFDRKPWRYVGVDLTPGKNVDLVLREAYHWRELESESVDVLVSGQTFEHTEFLWETILEITRVLKPAGLCCIIAPATGAEHRFPVDCWRIYSDGFRALARYAGLEVLFAHTHWEELAKYDDDSNKWHESVLVARKREEPLGQKIRRRLFDVTRRWLHPIPQKLEAVIQVYYATDGAHSEEASVTAGVNDNSWQNVLIPLPPGAGARPLRIDFMHTREFVEIEKITVGTQKKSYFSAATSADFDQVTVAGDAARIEHPEVLRLRITGVDPQIYLPILQIDPEEERLEVELRLRVLD
ncbi:MAG: methyltransferase domain-containing protein [Spartobacteria bacterium]